MLSTHGADTTTSKKNKQTLADTSKDTGGNPKLVKRARTLDTVASPLKRIKSVSKQAKSVQDDTTQENQIKKETSSLVKQGPLDKLLVAKSCSKSTVASRRRPSSSKAQGLCFETDLIDIPTSHLALVVVVCL